MNTLVLVEAANEKRKAQRQMVANVRSRLARIGKRNIGFPSGNKDEVIYSDGDGGLYCAFGTADDARIERNWNVFGVYEARRHAQMITVEVNIPTTGNSAAVAGFFGRDPVTDAVYLMHDGSVGGGKKGVGRGAFLRWSNSELVDVERTDGPPRLGIIIGRVDDDDLSGRLWRFVTLVRAFKDAVKSGALDSEEARQAIKEWDRFKSERSGRRRGKRRSEIDYISYHGDVVQLLRDAREARRTKDELVTNSPLIDLLVKAHGAMTEIYEVKTDLGRQSLYTAIGQLMTHSVGAAPSVERTLVAPEGPMPEGLDASLKALGIAVQRFKLTAGPKRTVKLL